MQSYLERLNHLNLETLERRRIKADLLLCYKVNRGLIKLEFERFFTVRKNNTRGHSVKLVVPKISC